MAQITASGANQWTDWVELTGSDYTVGVKPASLLGTVTVQAKRPSAEDAEAFSVVHFVNGVLPDAEIWRGMLGDHNWLIRAGIAPGNFMSGTAVIAVFS